MAIERCSNSGLTKPECSCQTCGRLLLATLQPPQPPKRWKEVLDGRERQPYRVGPGI